MSSSPQNTALFVSAFFDELIALGIEDAVLSPGSRSTPLSMVAYASKMNIHVDIDERGAAFFALGLAKASGKPVALICTSGTAGAHYYPAVLEAESSRVPLLILTGDRPPTLQNLGAPQTCDQLNFYGNHVKHFQQMPLPGSSKQEIGFVRQIAIEAFSRAVGSQAGQNDAGQPWFGCISDAGPVHINFPFEEPLTPDLTVADLFTQGRSSRSASPLTLASLYPDSSTTNYVLSLLREKRTLVMCGEGTCVNEAEKGLIVAWARAFKLPLLADPLSNLRGIDDVSIIDNYDTVFGGSHCPSADLIIRFGRWPVSKACFTSEENKEAFQIVVDAAQTRDFNVSTDLFVKCTPAAFVATLMVDADSGFAVEAPSISSVETITINDASVVNGGAVEAAETTAYLATESQTEYARLWQKRNTEARARIEKVRDITEGFEGAFIRELFEIAPENSCVFSASSLAIRMIDTFYLKSDKKLTVLCNRGLNGIDGCISSALGAAHAFDQLTLVIGDIAFIHDMNALAMNREFEDQAVIIVLMNNKGGGIFDMLPQRSEEPYFKQLFLTHQQVEYEAIAKGFSVSYAKTVTVGEFSKTYQRMVGEKGIHLIEVPTEIEGLKERYGDFLA